MLNKIKILKGYKLESLTGEIGKVVEFYFDDKHWAVRYLVADTGNWLVARQVLISPLVLISVNKEKEFITIDLTKKQIEESPLLETDKPVSRQFEKEYHGYYGMPEYWAGPLLWGAYPYVVHDREQWKESQKSEKVWDHHLRSTQDVSSYTTQAIDGEIGHVVDFIIDDDTWAIRYLIIDTQNWWPGKKVLISPQWIDRISEPEAKVYVNVSRDSIKESPDYNDELLLTRGYETAIHSHYDRHGYWVDDSVVVEHIH